MVWRIEGRGRGKGESRAVVVGGCGDVGMGCGGFGLGWFFFWGVSVLGVLESFHHAREYTYVYIYTANVQTSSVLKSLIFVDGKTH